MSDVVGYVKKTPDCGPHCRSKVKRRLGGVVTTYELVHCKKRKCKLCHRKPVKT